MKTNDKKLIVVLGMHRSGTSAVARGLQVMGVELGDNLMPPTVGNNPKGFWEDMDIYALNIEMLSALNNNWDYLTPIQPVDMEILHIRGYTFRALELLEEKTSNVKIFGFKDPRTAKLLPLWKKVFAHSQLNVSYVVTIRHPRSVCQSLSKRDGFDFEKSYLLWLEHVIYCLVGTVNENCIVIDYDHLMQSPKMALERVAKKLHLNIDPAELEKFETDFLDQKLRHTVYQTNDLKFDTIVPPLVQEVYEELFGVAMDKTRLDSAPFRKKIVQWDNELSRQKSALVLADKLTSKVMEKEHTVQILSSQIDQKEQTLQRVSARLEERELELAEIRGSRTWKIALLFRRARVLLAPPNSQRARLLSRFANVILPLVAWLGNLYCCCVESDQSLSSAETRE
jgi:hypothetical protein